MTTALAVLDDLVVDFPFFDDASRHNAYGMMLTPLLALAIRGNIPQHLVWASIERTGKGLLINTLLGNVVLGADSVPTMQPGSTEEEREKRITALIINGTTVIHFDNLPTEEMLNSPSLASLSTSRMWSGRRLTRSETITLPNTLIPVFSGNNPKLSAELTKRTVPIRLQPRSDHPEERSDFVHPDVRTYAREHRRDVLKALIGMVTAWHDAGQPPPPGSIRMGGFEEWVRVIGGVLHHAGATAWMGNYRDWIRAGDDFEADAAVLFDHWWQNRKGADASAGDVLIMVRSTNTFPSVLAGPESGETERLAKRVLRRLVDRPVGNWLMRKRASGSASRYTLTKAG